MWDLGVSGLRIRAQIEGPSHFRTQVHTVMTEGQVLRTSASGRTTWKKAFKRKDSTRAKKKILCAVFTSENQDYFFFANLCNFKGLITQKLNQYDFLNLPVLVPQIWSSLCSSPSPSSWDPVHHHLVCMK